MGAAHRHHLLETAAQSSRSDASIHTSESRRPPLLHPISNRPSHHPRPLSHPTITQTHRITTSLARLILSFNGLLLSSCRPTPSPPGVSVAVSALRAARNLDCGVFGAVGVVGVVGVEGVGVDGEARVLLPADDRRGVRSDGMLSFLPGRCAGGGGRSGRVGGCDGPVAVGPVVLECSSARVDARVEVAR